MATNAQPDAIAGAQTFSPGGRSKRAGGLEKKTPAGSGASPSRAPRRRRRSLERSRRRSASGEDEHRIGLHPIVRRLWVEQGEQPVATVNWKREWLWLYGFVQPQTGLTYWWILPYVNTKLFSRVLKDFAKHFDVGQKKRIVLPLDQAGWHTSKQLEIPEGIHLVPLPPYSPELQPAERLWPLVDEPLANQAYETLDEVEELVYQRCRRLLQQQQLIRGLTCYHWWPEVDTAA